MTSSQPAHTSSPVFILLMIIHPILEKYNRFSKKTKCLCRPTPVIVLHRLIGKYEQTILFLLFILNSWTGYNYIQMHTAVSTVTETEVASIDDTLIYTRDTDR